MALAVGTRLGVYEILSPLGAGGMGEVYRARDTKLNRDVAIKMLPEAVATDRERLARFEREAQVLAALNHPHIAHIHGFDDSTGTPALVMELVEGPTLADRIAKGALPVDEALAIAKQIAEALEAAHEQGIIHRDLKPANIKVKDDGMVKVLDFGLARALQPTADAPNASATMSPTITTPAMMTGVGVILGTAAYMSPEQAKGRPADKRGDVWAFGCMLYEMLIGRRPFEGEDIADTLASVLRSEPDWNALPLETPPSIRSLIQRCLIKDRHQRIGDLGVARFVMSEIGAAAPPTAVRTPVPTMSRWQQSLVPVAVATVATGLIVAVAVWWLRPAPAATPLTRFALTLPQGQQFPVSGRHVLALSPDGSKLVYVSNNRLYVRALSELEPHVVPGTESNLTINSPAFSPDGQWIAFAMGSDNTIRRVSAGGGVPVTVCAAISPYGLSWHASGILIGQGAQGIIRCSPNGGTPERLATVDPSEQADGPQLLSDGSTLLFTIAKAANGVTRWDTARIVMQTLKSGKRETVVNGGSDGRYLATGHLLYAVGGVVLAAAFSPDRPGVIGTGVPVIEGVRRPLAMNTGAAQFDVSPTGTLAYVPGPVGSPSTDVGIAIADRSGVVTRISTAIGAYNHVRASRDGKYLAIGSDDAKEAIVWITDVDARSTIRRLTIGSQNRFPIWSPDGQRVAFQSNREGDFGIFVQRADGAGTVERLTKATNGERHVPESWSPDAKHLSFSVVKDGKYRLWILSLDDLKAAPFANVESAEPIGSIFSPDGRWIAYAATPLDDSATTSANRGVFIQPFPAVGTERYQLPKQQMDFQPVWSAKGDELVYVPTAASGRLAIVSVSTRPSVTFGPLRTFPAVVTLGRLSGQPRAYDLLPDGRTVGLLSVTESDSSPASSQQIRVTLNWFEELKTRVPAK